MPLCPPIQLAPSCSLRRALFPAPCDATSPAGTTGAASYLPLPPSGVPAGLGGGRGMVPKSLCGRPPLGPFLGLRTGARAAEGMEEALGAGWQRPPMPLVFTQTSSAVHAPPSRPPPPQVQQDAPPCMALGSWPVEPNACPSGRT